MAKVRPGKDIFDFFGLARELRDLIYRELSTPATAIKHENFDGLTVVAHGVPKTNLLLANHQFKQEYLATAEKVTKLVIEDHLSDPSGDSEPYVPASLRQARALHFNLHAACEWNDHDDDAQHCPIVNRELVGHGRRIECWAKALPYLRSITVELHLKPHDGVTVCRSTIARNYSKLTSSSHVLRLDVYYNDFKGAGKPAEWDYGKGTGPVMKWTAESGVLVDLGIEPEEKEEAVVDA